MHTDPQLADQRVERFVRERLQGSLYREFAPVTVSAWLVPDEPVPFEEAITATYTPFDVGQKWGAPWSTVWFQVHGSVPGHWDATEATPELVVDLGFSLAAPGFQAEALVWRPDGTIVKAIEPLNRTVPVGGAGETIDLLIEAAANPNTSGDFTFAPTHLGTKATAGSDPVYQLTQLELGLRDTNVWELLQDFWTLRGLRQELPVDSPRAAQIQRALNRAIDAVDPDDVAGTADAGRRVLAGVLSSPANASAHRISAIGHAHIDTAWLWPVRETVRKVARTFSNVLELMNLDDEFVFAASSAQQYAWLKQYYPTLFERVAERVRSGRFVPVGGMWVESDTNLPSGESMVRQLVAGKRFFMDEFDVEPLDVWLPDSFGYSAALPQIVSAAGSKWFLTQKISWNDTNRMPHHTFFWEGIDGTRLFTHFPPVDTYNAQLSGQELAHAERTYAEKGEANTSLVPFGWGDGGGGPTREMLAAAHRTRDLEGSPRVILESPHEFFERAQAEYVAPPVWSGELYLEFHRGTYTSQARIKRGNRVSERLLREAELWATAASVRCGVAYPYDELDESWKKVLLQQFHDILPGTSIAWVYEDAERTYAEVAACLEAIIHASLRVLTGEGTTELDANAAPYAISGISGLGGVGSCTGVSWVPVHEESDNHVLTNERVRAVFDRRGLLISFFDISSRRELVPEGAPGNLFQLFRDIPAQWDAWELNEEDKASLHNLTDVQKIEVTESRDALMIERSFGSSTLRQEIRLQGESDALRIVTHVDWHERQKLLKLAFPLDVLADRAASEIQFGHIYRPTHMNTSWDYARFETVAHRWVHVGESGYGIAIANDASYGHDIRRQSMSDGAAATVVRVSLLRAPLYPDPNSDQGLHEFTISLRPHASIADAVDEGYRLNIPLRRIDGAHAISPLISVDNPAVVIEAVKCADDRSGDVILRLYEAHGTRARATLSCDFDWGAVTETDLLERETEQKAVGEVSDTIALCLRPFQLVTLRVSRI